MIVARTTGRAMATVAMLVVALLWLAHLGDGSLSAPPLSAAGIASWFAQRDVATAAFALLRLLALAFGAYLLLVISLGAAARALRLARATAVIDRVTLPFARTVFGGVALLGVISAPQPLQPQAHDTMVELPSDSSSNSSQATLHLLPELPQPTPAPTAPMPTAPEPEPAPPSDPAPLPTVVASDQPDTWVVEHGQSFWVIAQSHLDDVRGQHVDEREVDTYWRRLVELNRSRLFDANEPDLLFTGQLIELPVVVG